MKLRLFQVFFNEQLKFLKNAFSKTMINFSTEIKHMGC